MKTNKKESPVPRALSLYIIFQAIIIGLCMISIVIFRAQLSLIHLKGIICVLIVSVFLLHQLTTLKRWIYYLEWIRLQSMIVMIVILFGPITGVLLFPIKALSSYWLLRIRKNFKGKRNSLITPRIHFVKRK